MDCTICANGISPIRGVLINADTPRNATEERCRRPIRVRDGSGPPWGHARVGRDLTRPTTRSRFQPEKSHGAVSKGATFTASPSTTGDHSDRPSQGTREGSGGPWLDRTPSRVDRLGVPQRRRLHPRAVDEFPGLPPGEGSTRRARPSRAGAWRLRRPRRPASTESAGCAGSGPARSTGRSEDRVDRVCPPQRGQEPDPRGVWRHPGRARAAGGTQESSSPTVRSGAVAPGERMADGAAPAGGVLMGSRPSGCRTNGIRLRMEVD